MKSAVIFVFCLTYCHGDTTIANTLKMLQIDVLNNEIRSRGTSIIYQFTNNEKFTATCRRNKADGMIWLSWYKSGFIQNSTTEDKLELTLTLEKIDGDTNLECRLRVEYSPNQDYQNYQEWKIITLKYISSPMKNYVPYSVELKTAAPSPPTAPGLGKTIIKENDNKENDHKENDNKAYDDKENDNKENDYKVNDTKEKDYKVNDDKENDNKENDSKVYLYVSIILVVILVTLLLIFITWKMCKKFKGSKENDLINTAQPTINAWCTSSKDSFYEDSGFQETSVYSVPYCQAGEICSGSIRQVEADKTLDTTNDGNLINNNYYYQNKIKYQNLYNNVDRNVPLKKEVVNDYDYVHLNLYSI